MNIGNTFLYAAIVAFCYFSFLFVIANILKDNSILDIAWGPSFIVTAWVVLLVNAVAGQEGTAIGARQYLVAALVTVWGLRLGIRIFRRNRGKGEDPRYVKFREAWGKYFALRSYFQLFLFQGIILMLNVTPVLLIMAGIRKNMVWSDFLGLAVWVTGFLFESVGDYQLDSFLKVPENRGTIIDQGLWRYTRHPNYFGESTMWWGIFVIAVNQAWGWIGVIGPLVITGMLLFVSGIPMTEKLMENTPGWEEYKRRTSMFIPWFKKVGGKT
jgi:steroid 5-alpha reductase family enzyme